MENILFVSHCILNLASKLKGDKKSLEQELISRKKFLDLVLKTNTQLIQLPCPEFMMYGSNRWGHVKEQFDNPFFEKRAKELLQDTLLQIKEYSSNSDRYKILGIVTVEGSPSCGYSLTCKSKSWRGEFDKEHSKVSEKLSSIEIAKEAGVFMTIFEKELVKNGLNTPFFSLDDINLLLSNNFDDSKQK